MLKGILSISGQPGLFKMIAEAKNRIIVESLTTGKRMPASSTAKISSLEDIAVYTHTGDVPLKDILKKIYDHENGEQAIDSKSSEDEIRKFFGSILPDYDKERVYVSDIRKMILWYNILHEKGLLVFPEPEEDQAEEQENPVDQSPSE